MTKKNNTVDRVATSDPASLRTILDDIINLWKPSLNQSSTNVFYLF